MGPIKHDDGLDTNSPTNRRCSIKSIESDYDVSDLSGKPFGHGNKGTSVSLNSYLDLKNISEMTLIQEQLWIFSSEGDLSEVKRILKQGCEVHFLHSEYGNSPLHVAVENGHTEVVKAILNQGIRLLCCFHLIGLTIIIYSLSKISILLDHHSS